MLHYIVISDAKPIASALQKVIETLFAGSEQSGDHRACHVRIINRNCADLLERLNIYNDLADWIESILANGRGMPQQVIACVSVVLDEMKDLDPINHRSSASVIGMLMLTFPEVEWVLGTGAQMPIKDAVSIPMGVNQAQSGKNPSTRDNTPFATPSLVQAVNLMRAGYTPLFDGGGLRNALYSVIRVNNITEAWYLPRRESLAAAIDDERSYAFFNAYVAYRFGFRVYAVTTLNLMQLLLREGPLSITPNIVVEDLHLNFKDREVKYHLSDLKERDKDFKPLANVKLRVIASSGGSTEKEKNNWKKVETYLSERGFVPSGSASESLPQQPSSEEDNRKWWSKIMKPFSGVFHLYKDGGIEFFVKNTKRGKQFVWPPKQENEKTDEGRELGHSCTGVLLVVAERLISRARQLKTAAESVESSVYGAVLSGLACELLGCKTPTSALEALALKHYFEALSECQFYGVQSSVDVQGRLADLKEEVKTIGKCFDKSNSDVAVLNGRAAIVDMLVQLYREQNQFDEEQKCLDEARALHREIRLTEVGLKSRKGNTYSGLHSQFSNRAHEAMVCAGVYVLRYLHFCLRSFSNFLVALAGWTALLTVLCAIVRAVKLTCWPNMGQILKGAVLSFADAVGLFLGLNALTGDGLACALVSTFGIVLGFVHVGILISYLYSVVSRR